MQPMMPFRVDALQRALDGLKATGVPLVAKAAGGLGPAGMSDDIGIYAVVPWIASVFGLTAPQATLAFLVGSILIGSIVGAFAVIKCCDNTWPRVYGLLMLAAVAWLTMKTGDVYVYLAVVPLLCLPWILMLAKNEGIPRLVPWTMPVAGLLVGFGHMIRSHSGTPVVLVLLALIALDSKASLRRKSLALGALALGIAIAVSAFGGMVDARDRYLTRKIPGYVVEEARHPFWHSVYIGFGYTPNDLVSEYRDEVAIAKVEEVAPGTPYLSEEYENILRDEVAEIVREEPGFVLGQAAAKVPPMAVWLMVFGNVGLLYFVFSRPPLRLWLGVAAALAFEALFGLLVVPSPPYLIGLASLSAIAAILGARRHFDDLRATPVSS